MSAHTKKQRYERDLDNLNRFNELFPGYHATYAQHDNSICYHCINKILNKCDIWLKHGQKSGNFGDVDAQYRHLEPLVSISRSGKSIVYSG